MRDALKIIGIMALLLLFWQLIYIIFNIEILIIPDPKTILFSFVDVFLSGEILIHIFYSLLRVVVGFILAAIVGVGLSLVLGYFPQLGKLFIPIVEILRPIPPIAWIPIAILLFGLGNASAFFIVFLGAFFPIFTNSYFGVLSLPIIYRNIATSFEFGKIIFITKILLPFSLPYIFTGFRIGMGMAWMSVIAAELIGAQSGLGYFIQINRLLLQTDKIIVGMLVIGLLGFVLVKIIDFLEYIIVPWNRKKYVEIAKY